MLGFPCLHALYCIRRDPSATSTPSFHHNLAASYRKSELVFLTSCTSREIVFLFLITISAFPVPTLAVLKTLCSPCVASYEWLVAMKSPVWQAGAALHRGFWSSRCLSWWYFSSPLFLQLCYFTSFCCCHTVLVNTYASWEHELRTNKTRPCDISSAHGSGACINCIPINRHQFTGLMRHEGVQHNSESPSFSPSVSLIPSLLNDFSLVRFVCCLVTCLRRLITEPAALSLALTLTRLLPPC